jgi:hypothetical protein
MISRNKHRTYVEIEFGPWSDVPDTRPFPGKLTHGGIGETITDSTSHNAQSLDVVHNFWECCE